MSGAAGAGVSAAGLSSARDAAVTPAVSVTAGMLSWGMLSNDDGCAQAVSWLKKRKANIIAGFFIFI